MGEISGFGFDIRGAFPDYISNPKFLGFRLCDPTTDHSPIYWDSILFFFFIGRQI